MSTSEEGTAEVASRATRKVVEQAGVIAVWPRPHEKKVLFGVVKANSPSGEWVLAKGHLEEDETSEEAAIREAAEELGAEGLLLSSETFFTSFLDSAGVIHNVTWFPMIVTLEPQKSPEGRVTAWHTIYDLTHAEGKAPLAYPEMREMLHRVRRMI